MRRAARAAMFAAGSLCLLTACQQEPDFDERYEAAEKNIREKAAELDADIAEADRRRAAQETMLNGEDQRAPK